jgi:hypothetical protein
MDAQPRSCFRSAPGGLHPSQWAVVTRSPGLPVVRFFDTEDEADAAAKEEWCNPAHSPVST